MPLLPRTVTPAIQQQLLHHENNMAEKKYYRWKWKRPSQTTRRGRRDVDCKLLELSFTVAYWQRWFTMWKKTLSTRQPSWWFMKSTGWHDSTTCIARLPKIELMPQIRLKGLAPERAAAVIYRDPRQNYPIRTTGVKWRYSVLDKISRKCRFPVTVIGTVHGNAEHYLPWHQC